MPDRFNRSAKVQISIGSTKLVEIQNLRIAFKTSASLSSSGGEGDISIWNVNKTTRGIIEESKQDKTIKRITLFAGYGSSLSLIYSGNLTDRTFKKEATDGILQLLCKDGQNQKSLTINKNYGPGTGLRDIVRDLMKTIQDRSPEPVGIIEENVLKLIPNTKMNKGLHASGLLVKILEDVLNDVGVEISFQNGSIQLMFSDKFLEETIIDFTSKTGLLGKPEKLEDGRIKFRSQLTGLIKPGKLVRLESDEIARSRFTCETVSHDGDTRGNVWETTSEARAA